MSRTIDIRNKENEVIECIIYGSDGENVHIDRPHKRVHIDDNFGEDITASIDFTDLDNLIKALEFAHKELLNQIEKDKK